MPARLTPTQAQALQARLLDPLLAQALAEVPAPKARSTAHRMPKVARRIGKEGKPEGRGRVGRNDQGLPVFLEIDLDLLPVPKERARVVRLPNGRTTSYTPPRTKRFTADIRAVLDAVMGDNPAIAGPVRLTMIFRMAIPEGWPQWKKEAARCGQLAPTGRPDMDNLEKALLDALNGRAFVDDAYVVDRIARKRYADAPGIFIEVEALAAGSVNDPRALITTQPGLGPALIKDIKP